MSNMSSRRCMHACVYANVLMWVQVRVHARVRLCVNSVSTLENSCVIVFSSISIITMDTFESIDWKGVSLVRKECYRK